MSENLLELLSIVDYKVPGLISGHEISNDELTIFVGVDSILKIVEFLGEDTDCQFSTLIDITAVDYPEKPDRFQIVYHFLSMYQNQRIRIVTNVAEEEFVPSITGLHSSANWFEREVFDMYGVFFSNHPDLRRLLTDYGFTGHPLRKDFPTSGYVEVRYDEKEKKVIYEPTSLNQEYRQFDFLSPWEGANLVKTDLESDKDEKAE
jgi:NADH-quinone oxidoreductase subunit C